MKKLIALICIISILSVGGVSYAGTPLEKLGRGAANIATSPLEVYFTVVDENKDNGPAAALTWGALKGLYRAVARAVVGVYEVATFPLPHPENYDPIIVDPEYLLEDGIF